MQPELLAAKDFENLGLQQPAIRQSDLRKACISPSYKLLVARHYFQAVHKMTLPRKCTHSWTRGSWRGKVLDPRVTLSEKDAQLMDR